VHPVLSGKYCTSYPCADTAAIGYWYSVNVPDDQRSPTTQRFVYILLIWNNVQPDQPSVWRGYLESISGERHYFHTLVELNELLIHLAGWVDPTHDALDI
jgi:hypothetical protein